MKLYYSPGACSLADHIALHEASFSFDHEKVDLGSKRTEGGADYNVINPKGYVPALTLDTGETLTENVAILDWIAHQKPALMPTGATGHTRLLMALAFISTEIHKSFVPFFAGAGPDEKTKAGQKLSKRFGYLADTMEGDFLFGSDVTTADCYLFTMLTWAKKHGVDTPAKLVDFRERMAGRPAVQEALRHEGLA